MSDARNLDLHSIDDIITAMYAAISGEPGTQDWSLSRKLFHPQARMVRTRLGGDGQPVALSFSVDEYQKNASELLKDTPFYEIEIARHEERFGNIANVYSAYEARTSPNGGDFIKRGMNMIHLFDDGTRFWIMHMIWDDEREGLSLPAHLFSASGHA